MVHRAEYRIRNSDQDTVARLQECSLCINHLGLVNGLVANIMLHAALDLGRASDSAIAFNEKA